MEEQSGAENFQEREQIELTHSLNLEFCNFHLQVKEENIPARDKETLS